MPVLKIELSAEAERIVPELEGYCARHGFETPQLMLELNASAVAEQAALIKRLLNEIKDDNYLSGRIKKDLSDFLGAVSLSMKRAVAGRFNPTELTAASIARGRTLSGGLRGVAVKR